jgi:hypothetical protein
MVEPGSKREREKEERTGLPLYPPRACPNDLKASHSALPLKISTTFQGHQAKDHTTSMWAFGDICDPNYSNDKILKRENI